MIKKISVIIPVYNVKDYLEKCVESVCNQSYPQLEIILVDDGSTDGSGELCDVLAQKDNRIRVIHQENRGLSGARNAGYQEATGDYITFLDSDDYIHAQTYECMLEQMKKYDASAVIAGFQTVYDSFAKDLPGSGEAVCISGRKAVEKLYISKEEYLLTVVAWNKLYKREALPQNFSFPEGRIHEDEYTSYRILYPLDKVVYLDKSFYYYRQRKDSIMHTNFSLKRLDALPAMKEAVEYFQEKEDSVLANKAIKRYLDNLMTMYDKVKENLPEEKNLLTSLKDDFIFSYQKYKDEVQGLPTRRRILYHCFLHNRPCYLLIKKMRG